MLLAVDGVGPGRSVGRCRRRRRFGSAYVVIRLAFAGRFAQGSTVRARPVGHPMALAGRMRSSGGAVRALAGSRMNRSHRRTGSWWGCPCVALQRVRRLGRERAWPARARRQLTARQKPGSLAAAGGLDLPGNSEQREQVGRARRYNGSDRPERDSRHDRLNC